MENYKLQVNTEINGDLYNIRAEGAAELDELVKGFAAHGESIITGINSVKELVIAKGIQTKSSNPSRSSGGQSRSSSASSNGLPDGVTLDGDGNPQCSHGKYKDLSSKNYKMTHYCPAPKGAPDQHKPVDMK